MLKSLLSLLLSKFYSKQESALVASLALPDKSVSTSVSVTGGRNEYVAPNDGYLEFITTVTNNGINVYGQVLQTSSYPREGRAAKLFVPIAKGKKIIFETAADTSATFYALVGGVSTLKKFILQGGGLCLNSLSSSLRRSSFLTRRSGSEVKGFSQTQIPEQYFPSTPAKRKFTRHRPMVGLRLGETKHRLMLGLRGKLGSYALIRKDSLESLFLFVRGTLLAFTAKQQILNHLRRSLFQVKALHSVSLVGGAL